MSILSCGAIFLVLGVIFVNGWTDAPTAIVSAVSSGAMTYRRAVLLAAVCNLAGVLATCLAGGAVASTITEMVNFSAGGVPLATAALFSVMAAIILFAVGAWVFGIPTSESHALMGALIGAALAVDPRAGVDLGVVKSVLLGLVVSVLFGLAAGRLLVWLFAPLEARMGRSSLLTGLRVTSGALAFLHGAQDGQKFLAVLLIARLMAAGIVPEGAVDTTGHLPSVLLVALIMALGTMVGGRRIVETVGEKMVSVDLYEGFCSDLAAIAGLGIATATGFPVSTTHAKTASMVGASRSGGERSVMASMLLTWVITMPACAVLAYLFTELLARFV